MLKKYSVLRGFVILCVGLLVFCLPPLQAQDSDFVTWNKVKARYDVSSKVELYGDVEMRTRDALDEIDRWGFGVGTSVLLLPFLKAEGGYEYHYRNRGEDGLEIPAPLSCRCLFHSQKTTMDVHPARTFPAYFRRTRSG